MLDMLTDRVGTTGQFNLNEIKQSLTKLTLGRGS